MQHPTLRLSNERLLEILSLSPNATAVYTGGNLVIQSANLGMIGYWGKDSNVIGKPLEEAVPELIGQPFLSILRKVWNTGISFDAANTPAVLRVNGELQTFYFDFMYQAIRNEQGDVESILHTAKDVTELNLDRDLVANARELHETLGREQTLNEELAATNEELMTSNEELATTMHKLCSANEELQETKNSLQALNDLLEIKVETRTRKIESLNAELEASNQELRDSNIELGAANERLLSANEELFASRKDLEKSLAELSDSEYRTRGIIEAAPFPIGIFAGREMRIIFANKSITDVWGKGDDVVGKLYADILPELDNQEIFTQVDGVYTTGMEFQARNQQVDLVIDGVLRPFFFNYNFTALRNERGEIYGVMSTGAEVTDVVLAKKEVERSAQALTALNAQLADLNDELLASNEEQNKINLALAAVNEKLRISQQDFQLAIEAAGLATFDYNPQNGKFGGNELLKAWFGLQPQDEIALDHAMSVIDKADRERVMAAIKTSLSFDSGGDYDIYYTIITPQYPDTRTVRAKGKALFDELHEPIRFTGIVQDVTKQTRSENKMRDLIGSLEASEKKFRLLIKQAPVAINVFKTRDLIIDSINDKMLEIWGKTDEINGMRFLDVLPEMQGQPFADLLQNVMTTGETYHGLEHKAVIRKNGQVQERFFNFIYQPIHAEDGTVDSVLQVVTEVTEQVNARREIKDINTRLNIAIDAGSLGSTEIDLATGAMECNEQFKKCYGREATSEFNYDDLLAAILPQYRDKVTALIETAIAEHGICQAEYEITWPDGSLHWIKAHGKARYDNYNKATSMVGIVSDITEVKEDEQRKNDFIGMVSHELKTPLTSLSAYIQLLQSMATKSSDQFTINALDMAHKQVKKMSTMINGFLDVSRLESGKLRLDYQHFNLAKLVDEVKEESMVTITTHKVVFAPVEDILIYADPDKIGQVVNNFLTNAVKYSAPGTTIHVACVAENNFAHVAVMDEGRGIDPEDQQLIFERYYRIKDQPATIAGFGIGLYVCAELIRQHSGKIWVESELGKGATFNFRLPI